jgi:hypothetical protein
VNLTERGESRTQEIRRNEALLPATVAGKQPRISPTVVSQFVRLDQCRRYLRLALHERMYGPGFMRDYNVAPQEILPLLTRAGAEFEERVEAAAAQRFSTRTFSPARAPGERQPVNEAVIAAARGLGAGETIVLFQTRLRVTLDGWDLTGDADIVRFERDGAGQLHTLVADMKATTTAKIEHRLQVAFYREMLDRLLSDAEVEHLVVTTGILYRGGVSGGTGDDVEVARIEAERAEARRLFNVDDAQLELTPDPEAYRDVIRGLVTGADSVASVVSATPFADIPWHLTYKCDGCLYNEFCMKWAAEHDDLSLLPHLSDTEKAALQRTGIATTSDLAALMEPATDQETGGLTLRELKPAPGQAAIVRRISRTWPVGPRLDELVHRARRYRRCRGDPIGALSYIPSKGYGSLPYSDAEHNPNLVKVFIDAQHDYLLDRLYLIGALVTGNEAGMPASDRRRSVVAMTDAPPDETSEGELLTRWIEATIRAVADVAAPDEAGNATAPIHLIFYNQFEQKLILQALGPHAGAILAATPLYDFITQLAAFDSPVATFLDREIRELKNYPIVCQSLQAVASYARPNGVRFDWNAGEPYREMFRERMFDALGRLDGDDLTGVERTPWFTRRSRFNSQIPLEYAYAAWGALPGIDAGERDPYQPFRRATLPLLKGFQERRLEALEHIANDFRGNRDTKKTNFAIPDLSTFDGMARGMAEALRDFVTIERHVELAAWKAARLAPPERRVLSGDTLLVRYDDADQSRDVSRLYAENQARAALREEQRARYREAHPEAKQIKLSKEEKALSEPLAIDEPFRLRIDVDDTGVSLDDALALSTLGVGNRIVLEPRWTTDSRLPAEDQTPLTPTPKQLLYGMRMEVKEIEVARDGEGRATEAWLHLSPALSFASPSPPGYLFRGFETPLVDGERYTVDPDPNSIYGFWGAKVVEGLVASERNTLFERVESGDLGAVEWPAAARDGQARFMAGLAAMHEAGVSVEFEASKAAFIGANGEVPLLLVQGPPGTGKSFTTAFAVLARLQGALAAGKPYRVLIGAKTHAATDVLLASMLSARQSLARMRDEQPEIFAEYFDARILEAPLYRLQPREEPGTGVTALHVGKDQPIKPMDVLQAAPYAIVASTPGGVYRTANESGGKLFAHELIDLLVLDEASQLSLPESIMAALPMKPDGQIVIVGDHRQMAPIVKHDWEQETRRTFQEYAVYRSLFDTVQRAGARMIQFEESFRLDRDIAEFLRRSVYSHDELNYHSRRDGHLRQVDSVDVFVNAVLNPKYPLIVVVHDEAQSQLRNDFERDLTAPLLAALHGAGYRVRDGFGLVVPHRAQRANLQEILRRTLPGPEDPDEVGRAVDTVERFQGGERDAIIVSATESDPAYLLAAGAFLYDPRRLTVAISRAKDKMILVASRSVFDLFSPDEETFANAQLWKDLLNRTCTVSLWNGQIGEQRVEVWGNPPLVG